MAEQYTSVTNVSNELNGMTINSSTTPSSSVVSGWIDEARNEIDLTTGMIWTSTVASSEYHDYDGGGILRTYQKPILLITELLAESNGMNATSEGWYSLSEGRLITDDFIKYANPGEVVFHGTKMPIMGNQNICISYTYGFETVPTKITRIATLIAARRTIESIQSGSATNEGGTVSVGTITVSDPTQFGTGRLKQIDDELKTLYSQLGTMKTYRLDREY